MLRGFHTATAGMISQQRRMEMLSNNLSNANTPGYKADQSSLRAFPELLLKKMDQGNIPISKPISFSQNQTIGTLHTGVYLQETAPNHTQGDMRPTGNQTDLAILNQTLPEGAAIFFTVENQDGTPRYTRNGNFNIDQQGYLTTNNGLYVLDENNTRIQLQSDTFELQQDGTIIENGVINTRIGIALAPNANDLTRDNNGLYRLQNGQALPSAVNNPGIAFQVLQGHIERSNVDTAQTMADMTAAFRAFEANQKIIQAYDMSMQKAANEIGRIN
ncbi:flagellar hook-basal body protein [Sutcliffiella horikoshii]|uniref:flagellar hook-basal body protein n=1 Tax=Sutcliffiella horikoshii TaxID=79883 RepID=UPI001F164878|nr:flagellar hook-basal body protein [Sutcliffiella horikoshii]MCG1021386.1 flagellar hook-basal body protein [Sutcliffiella horikoshii]